MTVTAGKPTTEELVKAFMVLTRAGLTQDVMQALRSIQGFDWGLQNLPVEFWIANRRTVVLNASYEPDFGNCVWVNNETWIVDGWHPEAHGKPHGEVQVKWTDWQGEEQMITPDLDTDYISDSWC